MITFQMPRIPLDQTWGMGTTVEAFALTYLAAYNGLVANERMVISYTRAWNFDQITASPRVVGNKPAYVIAYWRSADAWKVVVAIEGQTSRSQLAGLTTAFDASSVPGCDGRVVGVLLQRATDVRTALNLDADFLAALARPNTQITFAGFSMGAACAEILAFWYKGTNPARIFKVQKFASPSLGNSTWLANRNPAVHVNNVYCQSDPIWMYPQLALRNPLDIAAAPLGFVVYFPFDPNYEQFDMNGNPMNEPHNFWAQTPMSTAALLMREMNAGNPWYYHSRHAYRAMLGSYVADGQNDLAYRFNYLEHRDENSWQVRWMPGRVAYADFLTILIPGPADKTPLEADVPDRTLRPRLAPVIVPQFDDEWPEEAHFNVVPPIVSQTQRNRRVHIRTP